jgi:predicted Zn finger-like uncharacterized protein
MLVQCPNCQTTYKVADEVVKGGSPAFRCSRCKHTFELESGENLGAAHGQPKSGETSTAKPAPDKELSLPFAPKQISEPISHDRKDLEARPMEGSDSQSRAEAESTWSMSATSQEQDRAFVAAETDPPGDKVEAKISQKDFPSNDPLFPKLASDKEDNASNILAISPYLELRGSILPFVTLFSLLVIGFSLFAVIGYAHPEMPESVLKKIPLLGATVLKNNHLKDGILLKSLATASQSIQGNRDVFYVTGVALNQNPAVVREIQLTGKTYNESGKEIERQTIWVGNTLSPKILHGMTLEDIPQLQDLKPLKSFEIPPGDSVPFTMVFLRSAKNAKEFTCQVVSATGES